MFARPYLKLRGLKSFAFFGLAVSFKPKILLKGEYPFLKSYILLKIKKRKKHSQKGGLE